MDNKQIIINHLLKVIKMKNKRIQKEVTKNKINEIRMQYQTLDLQKLFNNRK